MEKDQHDSDKASAITWLTVLSNKEITVVHDESDMDEGTMMILWSQ